jgi:hypothetical protein
MARDPRYFRPHTLVEITNTTFQNRFLTRPSKRLNDIFLGVLGLAQVKHAMPICGVVVLSTHFHLLLVPNDAEHLANFMEFLNGNLSKEIGRLHGWKGKLWHDRYHLVPVSDEEGAQIRRLRYLLAAGVKEFLVDRVAQWPGVHSAKALIEGTSPLGHWYDRTKEYAARQRGEKNLDPEKYASEQRVVFSPLPCWKHLPEETWRRRVGELGADIDQEGTSERQRTGRTSLGVKRILGMKPTRRPGKVKKSPRPQYHAVTALAFKRWREALSAVLQAFREASSRLREGDLRVIFPEGTFPPALPFTPFASNLTAQSRGQPS